MTGGSITVMRKGRSVVLGALDEVKPSSSDGGEAWRNASIVLEDDRIAVKCAYGGLD